MLFKSENEGNDWVVDNSTRIDEVKSYSISAIEQTTNNPYKLFIYRGHIICTTDMGKTWNLIFDQGAVPEFLSVSSFHPDKIWAGGWTNIFSPYLVKSEDGGETWALLNNKAYYGSDTNIL